MVRLGNLARIMEALNGSPSYQESVSASTTTARNATAFRAGQILILQGDVDFFFTPGNSTVTAVAATSFKVLADERFILTLKQNQTHVAVILASGTGTVKMGELN